ncbi:HEAT repeat domain-containing protein [Geobacter sp. DSM 9736]|uniref:HEAT repeat domain-containing protein n=1 Tax=Geobacter sp. DSM 9736 TaxID=1277350 RepID=UPI000B5100DC|nr:HEAT repeat domain-containing protein [Geobacter sp. DSM 9736]SNB45093.1 HEAT repeat [Geobacter sp. DSM 9736]
MEQLQAIIDSQYSPDEETRCQAVICLLRYPLQQVKARLFYAMGDPSWRVRKQAVEAVCGSRFDEKLAEGIVELLRDQENAGLRNSAVEALVRIGGGAVPLLSRFVRDPDHDVRKLVVDILGGIGSPDTFPILIDALKDEDDNVRAAAAESLGKTGAEAAVPHLLQCLCTGDTVLRFTVLDALIKIGKPLPINDLLALATDPFLKKVISQCMGAAGDPQGVPFLLQGLRETRAVREAAAAALLDIRRRLSTAEAERVIDAPLHQLRGSSVVDEVLLSLDLSDEAVKERLIEFLGIIGDHRAAPRLLREAIDPALAGPCLDALSALGAPAAEFLVNAFADATPEQRRFIAHACGELRLPNSDELLLLGMQDEDPVLRHLSVTAAWKTCGARAIHDIAALTEDSVEIVRESALQAMVCLAPSALETLRFYAEAYAASEVPEKRRDAARLCAVLKDLDKLSILVKDENVEVRKSAVAALAEMGSDCIDLLLMALVDEDPDVRVAAVKVLPATGRKEVLDPLLLLLEDPDAWVRSETLIAIGKLGDETAFESIAELITMTEAPVAISALQALAEIDSRRACEKALIMLGHRDEEVVKAAMAILESGDDGWVDSYRDILLQHAHWDVRCRFATLLARLRGADALPWLESVLEHESDEQVRRHLSEVVGRLK